MDNPMIIKHRTKEKFEIDIYRGHCISSDMTFSNKKKVIKIDISDRLADRLKDRFKVQQLDFMTLFFIEIVYQKDMEQHCLRLIRNNRIVLGIKISQKTYMKILEVLTWVK